MDANDQLFTAIAELNKANRSEIHGHDFGGVTEVHWSIQDEDGEREIAYGYFGETSTVHVDFTVNDKRVNVVFRKERAKALRHCGRCVSVETDSTNSTTRATVSS